MTKKTGHSPLPYSEDCGFIEDINGNTVGLVTERGSMRFEGVTKLDKANAKFIITACNNYHNFKSKIDLIPGLLLAAKQGIEALDKAKLCRTDADYIRVTDALDALKKAVAQIEVKVI